MSAHYFLKPLGKPSAWWKFWDRECAWCGAPWLEQTWEYRTKCIGPPRRAARGMRLEVELPEAVAEAIDREVKEAVERFRLLKESWEQNRRIKRGANLK